MGYEPSSRIWSIIANFLWQACNAYEGSSHFGLEFDTNKCFFSANKRAARNAARATARTAVVTVDTEG